MTLGAWLHTLDPVLLPITEGFAVRWYGLSYLIGFLIAFLLLRSLSRRGLVLVPPDRVADAMLWLIGGTLVGGRLGYVLVYQPSLAWTFVDHFPWWGLPAINVGGMASHGGMVGMVLASWRISRGWRGADGQVYGRAPLLHITDCVALVAPFGVFLGRVANFINGELLGRVVSPPGKPGPWWSVQFPQELRGWEAPGFRTGHAPALTPEQEQQLWALVEPLRIGNEPYWRAVERVIANASRYEEQLRPLLASRHPSQLYQAVAEGLLLAAVLWAVWARPRSPGTVTGWCLVMYGLGRIATEFWRLPDPQFEVARPLGLSRGQWLSAGMVVIGAAVLWWVWKRGGERVGGWLRGRREKGT